MSKAKAKSIEKSAEFVLTKSQKPSRRSFLATGIGAALIGMPGAAECASAIATDRRSLPALCSLAARIHADIEAVYRQIGAADDKLSAVPVPAEVTGASIYQNSDFGHLDKSSVSFLEGKDHAVPRHILQSTIQGIEDGRNTSIETLDDGTTVIRLHGKRQEITAVDRAKVERIRGLLTILDQHDNDREAVVSSDVIHAYERRTDQLSNRLMTVERTICDTPSRTAADILAKLRLFNLDPDMFEDSPGEGDSLIRSIVRDIPTVLESLA